MTYKQFTNLMSLDDIKDDIFMSPATFLFSYSSTTRNKNFITKYCEFIPA